MSETIPTPFHILLVEDDPADGELAEYFLNTADSVYMMSNAQTLESAKEQYLNGEFDLVLLDLTLPDGGFDDTLGWLKIIQATTPVVVLTGHQDRTVLQTCLEAGAEDCLPKDEMLSASAQRVICYAIKRRQRIREQNLTDTLAGYQTLSSPRVPGQMTQRLTGNLPLREQKYVDYGAIQERYETLLTIYLEHIPLKKSKPRRIMESTIAWLGDLDAGPQDLIDLHLSSLLPMIEGTSHQRRLAINIEGRLLALEMMGMLVNYYRLPRSPE